MTRWFVLGLLVASCDAPAPPTRSQERPILGGTLDTGDPTVGFLLAQNSNSGAFCSGTLITPTIFLTAAHCVDFADSSWTFKVYFTNDYNTAPPDSYVPVQEVHANPLFSEGNLSGGNDCGVVILSTPVTNISPKPYNHDPVTSSWVGQAARVVGFGLDDPTAGSGGGTKRQLSITIASITPTDLSIGRPDHTTCFGDSGGPLLTTVNGVETIIGITSYGGSACDGVGQSARVDVCATWIDSFMPDSAPPSVAIRSPQDGDSVPAGFDVVFDASDNLGVAAIEVQANGQAITTLRHAPWTYSVPAGTLPAGQVRLRGHATDGHGNAADSNEVTVDVKALGATPGDPGTSCSSDADCTGGGFCASQNGIRFCSRLCTAASACPPDFDCVATAQFTQQCVPHHLGDSGGCHAAPGAAGSGGIALLVLLFVGRLRTRTRG